EGEAEQSTENSEQEDDNQVEETSEGDRPIEMTQLEEIINDKRRQIIWKTRTSGLLKMEFSKYGNCDIITIWSQPGLEEITAAPPMRELILFKRNLILRHSQCSFCRRAIVNVAIRLTQQQIIYNLRLAQPKVQKTIS
ncbi:hypothetical protein, partial [Klebsiella pneumoniae]|uniref:hypothetical protein n=1 Tax=Klebsiella pneumoniae TaxID=573 RepID=UPI0040558227